MIHIYEQELSSTLRCAGHERFSHESSRHRPCLYPKIVLQHFEAVQREVIRGLMVEAMQFLG
jgi:hypothetical protein